MTLPTIQRVFRKGIARRRKRVTACLEADDREEPLAGRQELSGYDRA